MTQNTPLAPVTTLTGGAPEGFDARLIADLVARADGPVIHVLRNDNRLVAMQQALQFFAPTLPVFMFPAWDCLPYDRISPNADVSARRMATLAALADGFKRPVVILTTLNAVTQKVPARAVVGQSSFTAVVGKQLNLDKLKQFFTRMGFSPAPTVMEAGDFSIRGGLIDMQKPNLPLKKSLVLNWPRFPRLFLTKLQSAVFGRITVRSLALQGGMIRCTKQSLRG